MCVCVLRVQDLTCVCVLRVQDLTLCVLRVQDLTCDQCGYRGANDARLLVHQRLVHSFLAHQDVRHLVRQAQLAASGGCTVTLQLISDK